MASIRVKIKVVPGASQSQISGWLGDALKIRISEPPEKGKANKAVCKLLAAELGVTLAAVKVVGGSATARKIIEVEGVTRKQFESTFSQ